MEEEEDSRSHSRHRLSNTEDAKSYDIPDGRMSRVLGSQSFNTITTVSSPSGYKLAQQMTIAGSFLDFALFVADVEHLKFILDLGTRRVTYYAFLLGLLITSLTLQVKKVYF